MVRQTVLRQLPKTVGLPAAIATKLLLNGKRLPITGCHIPTHPTVYSQVLPELENEGMVFKEKEEIVEPSKAGRKRDEDF